MSSCNMHSFVHRFLHMGKSEGIVRRFRIELLVNLLNMFLAFRRDFPHPITLLTVIFLLVTGEPICPYQVCLMK